MHWRSLMKLLPENISFDQIRQFGTFIGLILLCALFTLLSPYFLTASNLMNVAQQSAIIAVISVGMTFVIITAGIDLSVGSVLAFRSEERRVGKVVKSLWGWQFEG